MRTFIFSLLAYLMVSGLSAQLKSLPEEEVIQTLQEDSFSLADSWQVETWWWPWPQEEPPEDRPKLSIPGILELENSLAQKIIGQPQAVKMTTDALICYQVGIHDPVKPIAAFLYIGPTGVGKTELAKELARHLFQDEGRLIRLDMSEYKDKEGLNRLLGMPHGYKDSEKGGVLSNAILSQPCSIVLLDEIEKSDTTIWSLFLHIFDEGYFTNAKGEYVDCRNCLFIATTNLGAKYILAQQPFSYEEALSGLEPFLIKSLSPEFYNRLEPVVFQGLTPQMLDSIVQIKLQALAQSVFKQKQIELHFDESVAHYLTAKGYHEELGARPLQRIIKYELTALIAKTILSQSCRAGDEMWISHSGKNFVVSMEKQ